MSTRERIVAYGSAALLVIAGIVCTAVISGGTGQYLAFALIGLGLVAVVSLVFYEVGLSEDRERARDERKRTRRPRRARRKLGRSRGHPRRLS